MPADNSHRKVAVIAGAGPAGLTAALELLRGSDVMPLVFETDGQVGGISRTINYRGNRMDLGGHRFFSKSDWVMRWWQDILPVATDGMDTTSAVRLAYQGRTGDVVLNKRAPESAPDVMLVRQRMSRIFYRRRFFDYPLKLNTDTLKNMGLVETLQVGLSYGQAQLRPIRPEKTLQDFFVNRFGDRLYRTFFKDYTEKVWGVPCAEISAEWGAQRIKGLSVAKALSHAALTPFRQMKDTAQRGTETSLIERFLYPKYGPGQMWEAVARQVASRGGRIHLNHRVVGLKCDGRAVVAVEVRDQITGTIRRLPCDQFISTMPVSELITLLQPADEDLSTIAAGLPFRDFMTAGLLLRRMTLRSERARPVTANGMPPDNWIYIQEPEVKIGRLQVFNNWSPAMVADPGTIWLGLEYFCRQGDELWSMDDAGFLDFAAAELERIGMIDRRDVIDGTVVRVPKAYPAYFGGFRDFGRLRQYLDEFSNLYPIGRNGMHRYNNQDHSMLAAKCAVDAIINDGDGKLSIWDVNAEEEYHEENAG